MATPAATPDLLPMYISRRYTMIVRARATPYGQPAFANEPFSGAAVLRDLAGAPDREIPIILARYAALRAWAIQAGLHTGPSDEVVLEHALSAARDHLAAAGPGWPEGELLARALDRGADAAAGTGAGEGSLSLLDRAAALAEARGHGHGGRALREAAHRARWWASGYPPTSLS